MNFHIYLPDQIAQKFIKVAEHKHLNKSAAIRQAIEKWIEEEAKSEWPNGFFDFEAVLETPDFSESRCELLPSRDVFEI